MADRFGCSANHSRDTHHSFLRQHRDRVDPPSQRACPIRTGALSYSQVQGIGSEIDELNKNDHNQDPGGIGSLLTHLGQSGIDLFLEDINWLGAFDQYCLCLSIYSVGHQE